MRKAVATRINPLARRVDTTRGAHRYDYLVRTVEGLADKMLPPRKAGVMIPGQQAHTAKLLFEKHFLWKSRNGYVRLP